MALLLLHAERHVLAVRPERMRLGHETAPNCFSGTVELVTYLGSLTEYRVRNCRCRRRPAKAGNGRVIVGTWGEGIDETLEEAALGLGATPRRSFRRVTLPLSLPGIAAGTILCLILAMNAYATPVLLGGPRFQMMAPAVYDQISGQASWPLGSALAFILMAVTLLLTGAATAFLRRRTSAAPHRASRARGEA